MTNPIVFPSAFACPVCGQRLSSSDTVCTECGAIPALRAAAPRRRVLAVENVRSRLLAARRRLSTWTSTASSLGQSHHRGLYVIVALLAATISVAAVVRTFNRPGPPHAPAAQNRLAVPEATRAGDVDRPQEARRPADGRVAARASTTDRTRLPVAGATMLGMIAAGTLAALLGGFAVTSQRRQRPENSANNPPVVRGRSLSYGAGVAAAFCLGLAVALAAVLVTESRMVRPVPALATVQGESPDHWQREAFTLGERLSVLDARLASLEAKRVADGQRRQQPTSTATVGTTPSESYAAADSEATAALPTADVLRSPRGAKVQSSVGDQVWNDIMNDWERVRRAVRAWLPDGSR